MSRQHITNVFCDVCKSHALFQTGNPCKLTVIQTTEQTEGRSVEPYLSIQELDLCVKCKSRVLEGNMLFSSGAQGYNTYTFKEQDDRKS